MNTTTMIKLIDIAIHDRIRKEKGSLDELMRSISEQGLINPITVMDLGNGRYQLITGLLRLEAVRQMGMEEIQGTIISPIDADKLLMMEIAENVQRKEFTFAEKLEYAARIETVERVKARERQLCGVKQNGDLPVDWQEGSKAKRETSTIVAQKAGFTSATQMRRIKEIAKKEPNLLGKIDSGDTSVYNAYMTIKDSEAQFVPDAALCETSENRITNGNKEQDYKPIKISPIMTIDIVEEDTIYAPTLTMFVPSAENKDSTTNSLENAGHVMLLKNPIYAAMYDHITQTVQTGNSTIGDLRFTCMQYARQIRSYEENVRRMNLDIERLAEENTILRAQLAEQPKSYESEDEII